jgi:hypothetical protein
MKEDWLSADTEIPDRKAFAQFMIALSDDAEKHPENWVRTDLSEYLWAVGHYAWKDVDSFHRNVRGTPAPEPPTWRLFADLLTAGRVVYED